MRHLLTSLAVAVMLAGCSGLYTHTEIEALNEAKSVGSPFSQRLTAEYKNYVRAKQRALDYTDARHFARKGLLSAEGTVVMPEPLSNWHLSESSAKDLRAGRAELLGVLNAGARAQAPFEAAIAQAKFDCWIEQEEQRFVIQTDPTCRAEFESALSEVKSRMVAALPQSEKVNEPIPQTIDPNAVPAEMDEGMFLAFFDFDQSSLNDIGLDVINQVAEQAKKRQDLESIVITGHADTAGPAGYNQRLSQRRADAVREALIARGVDAQLIDASGRGENELMVPTPNNTREPANRRAQIIFE